MDTKRYKEKFKDNMVKLKERSNGKGKRVFSMLAIALVMTLVYSMSFSGKASASSYASGDVWIGTDGNEMAENHANKWEYEEDLYYGGYRLTKYNGQVVGGKIIGVMPETINGINITNIGPVFKGNTSLSSAPVLPKTALMMESTFESVKLLTVAPELPSNLIVLNSAFRFCSGLLTAPTLPSTLKDMTRSFQGCSLLTSTPDFPDKLVRMDEAFRDDTKLNTVSKLPNSVKYMKETFRNSVSLKTTPVLPESLIDMTGLFYLAPITDVPVIPSGVTKMDYSFYGTLIESTPKIPAGVTSLVYTFANNNKLVKINYLPEGIIDITGIGSDTDYLVYVDNLPSTIINMSSAFENAINLTTIPELPSSVKDLSYAFRNCVKLITAPDIPDSAIDVSYMFYNCIRLTNPPVIGDSVQNMSYLFSYARELTGEITIPSTVTDYSHAFDGITNKLIVNHEGNIAFKYNNVYNADMVDTTNAVEPKETKDLEWLSTSGQVMSDSDKSLWTVEYDLVLKGMKIKYSASSAHIIDGKIIGEVPEIIDGVPVISMESAFKDNKYIVTAPQIPDTVKNLDNAFKNATSLESSMSMPRDLETMRYTYSGASKLTVVEGNIGPNVKDMNYAYEKTSVLSGKFVLPEGIQNIDYAWSNSFKVVVDNLPSTLKTAYASFKGTNLTLQGYIGNNIDLTYLLTGVKEFYGSVYMRGYDTGTITNLVGEFTVYYDYQNGPLSVIDSNNNHTSSATLVPVYSQDNLPFTYGSAGNLIPREDYVPPSPLPKRSIFVEFPVESLVVEPEVPIVTEPEVPPVDPIDPGTTEPEVPVVDPTEPETPVVDPTEPETPVVDPTTPTDPTDPEVPVVTEPEEPVITEPETPVVETPIVVIDNTTTIIINLADSVAVTVDSAPNRTQVKQARYNLSQMQVNIDKMEDSADKTSLQEYHDYLLGVLDDVATYYEQAYTSADAKVASAETSKDRVETVNAYKYVKRLPVGVDRSRLLDRLDAIQLN